MQEIILQNIQRKILRYLELHKYNIIIIEVKWIILYIPHVNILVHEYDLKHKRKHLTRSKHVHVR